jgi:hypothetical protein
VTSTVAPPLRCADVRRALAEGLHGTAPERAASWLLVEHPGPWPSDDPPPDLPDRVVAVLDAATEAGVRPQLVRRVNARRRAAQPTVVVASCRPGRSWLERRTVRDLHELTELDLAALADGTPPGFGARTHEPVVLVCTHGRRDVCCARLGRPLAVLLDQELPGLVWETTHVGGDRFAPNVVALPDGSYHGGLSPADVPALAAAVTSGRVLLSALRGRAGLPFPVQAADHFLRGQLGLDQVEAVRPVGWLAVGDAATAVELDVDGRRWQVRVRTSPCDVPRLTSCAGEGTVGRPASYELVSLNPSAERLPLGR